MGNLLKDIISFGSYVSLKAFNNLRNMQTVLVYHSVGPVFSEKACLDSGLFREHIKFISGLKNRDIIFTFDDGYSDFMHEVFPVVIENKVKSIIFVITDFVGKNAKYLNWAQIKELSDAGIEIGSHAVTHANLLKLAPIDAFNEISSSKKIIEDKIGKDVRFFAYPFGGINAFDDSIKDMVRRSGYKKAYSNIMGFNSGDSDVFELKRIRIYNDDNMFRFKLKINGAYNWVDKVNNFRYGYL